MTTASEFMSGFRERHKTERPKRKTAKQQIREERERIRREILAALVEHRRSIPSEWEHGYNSCRSVVERYFDEVGK